MDVQIFYIFLFGVVYLAWRDFAMDKKKKEIASDLVLISEKV
jgi:hypothetical protein